MSSCQGCFDRGINKGKPKNCKLPVIPGENYCFACSTQSTNLPFVSPALRDKIQVYSLSGRGGKCYSHEPCFESVKHSMFLDYKDGNLILKGVNRHGENYEGYEYAFQPIMPASEEEKKSAMRLGFIVE